MRAHTITTEAQAGARRRTKRRIVPGGILALSLAVVLLAATASTASAATSLNGDYDFGDQQVGTTSPAQHFILLVTSGDTINPSISVSGDYAQTNDCPPTLSDPPGEGAAGCTISVTFTPTAFGPRTGTLSAGPGGPTAALTGNGCSPPGHCPLTLFLEYRNDYLLEKNAVGSGRKFNFSATTNNDSTLVATGSKIKKTTKQLAAGEPTRIKAKLKHPNRLRKKSAEKCGQGWSRTNEQAGAAGGAPPGCPGAKIKVKATDEFGQTATEEIKVKFESF